MIVQVGDFLPVPIVDNYSEMVGNAKAVGDFTGCPVEHGEDIIGGRVEIRSFLLGYQKEVNRGFGADILNNDDIVGLQKDFGRQFSVYYTGED